MKRYRESTTTTIALERVLVVLALPEVRSFASVCRKWAAAARTEAVWSEFLLHRFAVYAHVPRVVLGPPSYEMVKAAVRDERRTRLTLDELCSMRWYFRFKRAAGESWIAVDPYWCHKPATVVRFHRDGSTSRAGAGGFMADLKIEWRWGYSNTSRPASGRPCDRVRVRVDGQDVPYYVVSRHPVHKGFLMQSCWALYTAFPMPRPGEDPHLDDDALDVGFEQQAAEALQYNSAQRASHAYVDVDALDAILRGDA